MPQNYTDKELEQLTDQLRGEAIHLITNDEIDEGLFNRCAEILETEPPIFLRLSPYKMAALMLVIEDRYGTMNDKPNSIEVMYKAGFVEGMSMMHDYVRNYGPLAESDVLEQ